MLASRQSPVSIQADFDRIARLPAVAWDHSTHYHRWLLTQFPPRCERALEIGCGTGSFTRLLAQRAEHVLGLDLSPEMLRVARERTAGEGTNVEFVLADAMSYPLPDAGFDCIATIATLHHLPIAAALEKVRAALKPGGVFVCLDLYQRASLLDWLSDAVAWPVSQALTLARTGTLRPPCEVRAAYAAHGETDVYPTLAELRRLCATVMPGARVRRHLFFRYSIVWRKPS